MTKPSQTADPVAAAMAAMRRRTERPCAQCGEPFTGIGQAKYCSVNCRVNAFNQRRREAVRSTPDA